MSFAIFLCCFLMQSVLTIPLKDGTRRNVLMIIADDLRPEIGAFYDEESQLYPHMFTPNMDTLAEKSAIFKSAHCQAALCGPSRTSFLTSRRPHTTSVFTNGGKFRSSNNSNIFTIPQLFKENGYRALGAGKVFHGFEQDFPMSWEEPVYEAENARHWQKMRSTYFATEAEINENPLPDTQIADYAIKSLRDLAPKALSGEEHFFLAVGFLKPHLTFLCPERLLEHYPMDKVTIADNQFVPPYFPEHAWFPSSEFKRLQDIRELGFEGEMNETLSAQKAREVRRAYYCTVSHVDEELGRVLKILKELGLEESTVVTFSGDHGWQLGEHSQWGKQTNFYLSTRTPLMIHVPGVTKDREVINDLVEFVDLMPTLAEAAGLASLPACRKDSPLELDLCTEGSSLLPLLREERKHRNTNPRRENVAYTQFLQGDHRSDTNLWMEYGVYDERYHYTKVVGNQGGPDFLPVWTEEKGDQLYDTYFDPDENVNVAHKAGYEEIKKEMETLLRKGFPN